MYDGYAYSSSAGTNGKDTIQETVTIGAKANADGKYVQSQDEANSQRHLAGEGCPLYGIKNKVHRDKTPKFQMSHLYSVVALNIVNEGDGVDANGSESITINTIDFQAPEAIVGEFVVNISGDEPTYVPSSGKTSSIASLQLSNVSIEPTRSATVYIAIKPFDASNKEITLNINGGSKTIKMPANFKFEAGKITTLRVPVGFYLGTPITNLMDNDDKGTTISASGRLVLKKVIGSAPLIQFTNASQKNIVINGESVNVYQIGSKIDNKYETGSVTITGMAPELIRLLPVQFYAAQGGEGKAIMRLASLKANVYGVLGGVELGGYGLGAFKTVSMDYNKLVNEVGINAQNITFEGVVPIRVDNANQSIILYEDPVHKIVSGDNASELLLRFDDDDLPPFPTYDGLYEALTTTEDFENWSQEARTTATIIFNKVTPILKEFLGDLGDLLGLVVSSPKGLFEMLKEDISVTVTIETAPINTTAGVTDTRVFVWGLNSPNGD